MYVEKAEYEHARRAVEILTVHAEIITAALRRFAEDMTAAAQEADANQETLRSGPRHRPGADASAPLITLDGYGHLAQTFRDRAESAQAAGHAVHAFTRADHTADQPGDTDPSPGDDEELGHG